MPTTSRGLPYPLGADLAEIPDHLEALALAAGNAFGLAVTNKTDIAAAAPGSWEGRQVYVTSEEATYVYDGSDWVISPMADTGDIVYTPTFGTGWGAVSGSACSYRRIGPVVEQTVFVERTGTELISDASSQFSSDTGLTGGMPLVSSRTFNVELYTGATPTDAGQLLFGSMHSSYGLKLVGSSTPSLAIPTGTILRLTATYLAG